MKRTKYWVLSLVVVAMVVLGGCQSAEPTAAKVDVETGDAPSSVPGDAPGQSPGGVPGGVMEVDLLALGLLELEETNEAVTSEQAAKLLPLWQMLAGGNLGGDDEINSVVKQIQGTLTESQLAAITTLELTAQSQQAWIEEQGIKMPDGGEFGPAGDVSDEERAAMREELQNMTAEERDQAMAERGSEPPAGGSAPAGAGDGPPNNEMPPQGAGGFRGGDVVIQVLIELLTERAAE